MSDKITFTKQCDCKGATATTGRIVMSQAESGETIRLLATFYPGPVCDACNTPWRREQ